MVSHAGAVLANPLSPDSLLGSSAVLILAIILFAECGLLIGFFLPGDTLLFAAGIKIAVDPGAMSPLAVFLVVAPIAAFAGNLVGYGIGYRVGPRVFDRPDSRFFRPEYVERSQAFFDRWGSWTILVGRFVPVVRTVATVMAGVARMRLTPYAIYSAIGAVVWADGMLVLGRELGKISFVQRNKGYVDYAVVVVVVLALLPALVHYAQGRRSRTQ